MNVDHTDIIYYIDKCKTIPYDRVINCLSEKIDSFERETEQNNNNDIIKKNIESQPLKLQIFSLNPCI